MRSSAANLVGNGPHEKLATAASDEMHLKTVFQKRVPARKAADEDATKSGQLQQIHDQSVKEEHYTRE